MLVFVVLLQGCMTVGVYQVKVLSYKGGVMAPRAEPLPLVAGVRIDGVDKKGEPIQPHSYSERNLLGSLTAELSSANLFRQVTYPTSGGEEIMFAVSTIGNRHGPLETLLSVPHVFVCAVTVLILCPPASATYEYNIAVRALKLSENEEMASYAATGKSRTRYGIFSSSDADHVGWHAAATSAFDDLMRQIRQDETGWLVGVMR
jgi:hypothetical protein